MSNPAILSLDDWQNDKKNGKDSGLGVTLGEKMSSVFSKLSESIVDSYWISPALCTVTFLLQTCTLT